MRNTSKTQKTQKGFGLISASMGLALLAYVAFQLIPLASRLQLTTFRIATVSGINELAQASKTYFVDPDHPENRGSWPMDTDTLVAGNYLTGFVNRNGYGYEFTLTVVGQSLVITTETPSVAQANNVAAHFGGLATVTDNSVAVVWSAPGNDANHEALVPRDGSRAMTGTLNLDNNDISDVNTLTSAGTIRARNAGSTALIDADNGAIDTLTANDIRVIF